MAEVGDDNKRAALIVAQKSVLLEVMFILSFPCATATNQLSIKYIFTAKAYILQNENSIPDLI
ncbi:hypothetical protein MNBD_GAMMA09-1217 [hydrothermal vent metagenome]|uniref:Uncharacterized protein n=1 Tax=hydrothermal vent metagenome TaxID=652676 RepID=A0A3B0Y9M8_9ZZZZ